MKKVLLLSIILLFVSCESNTDNDKGNKIATHNSLIVLNQNSSTSSTLTYYNSKKDSISQNVYKSVNEKDMGKYANQIDLFGDYIYIPVNGSALVRILNKDLIEVATVESFEAGFAPQYVTAFKNTLAVLWTKFGAWGTDEPNFYTLKIYDISKISEGVTTVTQTVELNGYAPLFNDGTFIYMTASKQLHKINGVTGEKKLLTLNVKPTDLLLYNNTIYVSFVDYLNETSSDRDISGGYLTYSTELVKTDSVNINKAVYKLASSEMDVYCVTESGKQIKIDVWPYWKSENTIRSIERINTEGASVLFSSDKLNYLATSSGWIRFKLFTEIKRFFVPEVGAYRENKNVYLFDLDGTLKETVQAGVGPVNAVYVK